MFAVGDVVAFWSTEAKKRKYHLCISFNGHYLFINSPKRQPFPGDFVVDCSELPFLTPTPSGKSIISCNLVMHFSAAELKLCDAKRLGAVTPELLGALVNFVMSSPVLSQNEKDSILDAAGDWC
jgi:hypothetical protein